MQKSSEIENIRHSFAHILAAAVKKFYPKAQLGIGPVIENGFYYDFGNLQLANKDLPRIEKEMRSIASQNLLFKKELWPNAKATTHFKKEKQPYKLELIKDLKAKKVGMVYTGDLFLDLCRGGHVKNTSELPLNAFKLTHLAGAYWRGDEKRPMLTRIYGLAFETKQELDNHLKLLEEARERDHKKIGKELDLFSFHQEAPGFIFWHPKGMLLRKALMSLHEELHQKAGYQQVSTPILLSEELWKKSGHWDHYKESMYFTKIDNRTFAIKPMNCPGTILIYKTKPRSWRELPLRLAEAGEVHRHEPSGTLNGLFRVRAFRQDDTHIFAKEDQVAEEVKGVITLTLTFYRIIGFRDVEIELSTRPEHSIGTDAMWRKAEGALKRVLKDLRLPYKINKGDGAFYGPKIDFHIKDLLGRSWQCGTIQLDFAMPERFDVTYVDKDGKLKRPVIIHRTVLGSIQRFTGILIEHYKGAFPLWLAPEQIWILPISDQFVPFANTILKTLQEKNKNLRVAVRDENETLGKKIREGEMQKIPYLLIVGEKEQQTNTVSVRQRKKGNLGQMNMAEFSKRVEEEINSKI